MAYYRIVKFKDGKAQSVKIVEDEDQCIRAISANPNDVEIYKCNKHGNNYTNRMVYPVEQVRNEKSFVDL